MTNDIGIGATLRRNINVINRTIQAFEVTSARLATGKKVNSALDNPQNYFAALDLQNRAADFSRRLDAIGQSLSVVQQANLGVSAIENLINQGEAIVIDSLEKALVNETDGALIDVELDNSPTSLRNQILSANPDVYYPLDDAAGPFTDLGNGGGVNATPTGGATLGAAPIYNNGGGNSVQFDGVNDHISVADSNLINLNATAARTVELVFNADDTTGRQILFEEGANVNGLTIYIDNGEVYVTAEDDNGGNRYADIFHSASINAGETYHVAFVFSAAEDRFQGFLNGVAMGPPISIGSENFPSHSGDVHIGGGNDGVQWHDGEGTGNAFHFQGRISDVAIYNRALTDSELFDHGTSLNASTEIKIANKEYDLILSQIDQIARDSGYRATNLLLGNDLITDFNDSRTTQLTTKGVNFTSAGLGLERFEFDSVENIEIILEQLRDARAEVRSFGNNLANDLVVLQTREDFTIQLINKHEKGADKLTLADQNEEGANQLALGTRLSLATTALTIGAQQQRSIGNLISTGVLA